MHPAGHALCKWNMQTTNHTTTFSCLIQIETTVKLLIFHKQWAAPPPSLATSNWCHSHRSRSGGGAWTHWENWGGGVGLSQYHETLSTPVSCSSQDTKDGSREWATVHGEPSGRWGLSVWSAGRLRNCPSQCSCGLSLPVSSALLQQSCCSDVFLVVESVGSWWELC